MPGRRPSDKARQLLTEARLKETLETFGFRVKKSRQALHLSQDEAAERAGISQSHWSKVERGRVDPSLGQVLKIQIALNAPSVESFFGSFPTASLADSSMHTPPPAR
jgi:transcriptional regulator with XRE-family HTH domain